MLYINVALCISVCCLSLSLPIGIWGEQSSCRWPTRLLVIAIFCVGDPPRLVLIELINPESCCMDMKSHHLESMDTEPTESAEPTEGENLTATVPEAWLDEVEADTAEGITEASGETQLPSGAVPFRNPKLSFSKSFRPFCLFHLTNHPILGKAFCHSGHSSKACFATPPGER